MRPFNISKKNKKMEDTFYIDIPDQLKTIKSSIDTGGFDWSISSNQFDFVDKSNMTKLELEIFKMGIEKQIKDFLSFLEYKDLIQEGEYKAFLESKLIAEKLRDIDEK